MPQLRFLRNWLVLLRTGVIFLLALLIYGAMAGKYLMEQSIAPHYVYLAEAFLKGQTSLIEPVISSYDLLRYQDKLYVAHQPLPALLIMPFLEFITPINFPDVLFTVLLGAVSVALCDLTLYAMIPDLSSSRRTLLTLFFALGTMHGYLSTLGTVWFTGQVAAAIFLWVFLLGMAWRLPWLAGAGLGIALLGRASPIPGALLLAAGWWWLESANINNCDLRLRLQALIKPVMLFSIPFLLCAGFLGWYNAVRFGSPLDFGYDYLIDVDAIAQRRIEHGTFSPVFLDENLYTATIRPPLIQNGKPEPDPWGMGLLLTSPVLVYGAIPFFKKGSSQTLPMTSNQTQKQAFTDTNIVDKGLKPLVKAAFFMTSTHTQRLLAVSALVMLLPALLYHNTGSTQFGYRFVLDALPVWMILVGMGARRGSIWLLAGLVVYCVLINLWGFTWMYDLINSQPH